MTFLDAVVRVSGDLRDRGGAGPSQAALQLAVLAWRTLAGHDPAWDIFGLEVLAVSDQLYPVPDVVVVAQAPPADGPEVRAAVRDLIEALATCLEKASAEDGRGVADRLGDDAAAVRLREAAAVLR